MRPGRSTARKMTSRVRVGKSTWNRPPDFTLTSASPSTLQETWRWASPSWSTHCELLTPSILLSVYCNSARDTSVSWRLSPRLNVILALLIRWISNESALTRSWGSEGSLEHDNVSIRGMESPEAYIFGAGSVSFGKRHGIGRHKLIW